MTRFFPFTITVQCGPSPPVFLVFESFYSHRAEFLGQGIGRLARPRPIQVITDKEKKRVIGRCPK